MRSCVGGYVDEDDVNIRSPIILNDGENYAYIPGNLSAPGSDYSLKERLPPLLPSWCMES